MRTFCVSLAVIAAALQATAVTQNVKLQTIDGTLVVHMPKGKALKVQFHENGVLDGPPQTVAFQQDMEDLKVALRKEFLGEMATVVANVETLTASLLAETKARTSADTALTASLNAETKARTSADTALTASLNAETKARTVGHSALKARVDAETKARSSADTALTASLTAETKARTTADTAVTKELKPLKTFGSMDSKNFLRKITRLPNPGRNAKKDYRWDDLFNKLYAEGKSKGSTEFVSGATYRVTASSSNGVHSHTYRMDLRIGGVTYGGATYRYQISNVKQINGPWHGGCGGNPFNRINDNYLRIWGNACFESIDLFVVRMA